ncbi:hypothetical protein PLICRDRAFT_175372 [Plicaturopsis crispa FD-325 SS-3]|nr:hypothetical protein PLICRDRAFT_175372 [Plicaturopsis crispa FD-325 SS-3]
MCCIHIGVHQVERVVCTKSGVTAIGTIHLTAHHLIFNYDDGKLDEMWASRQSPLAFQLRTFTTFSLTFGKDGDAVDVFESVKELTVATSVQRLYAFYYQPNPPLPSNSGWAIYSPREEFGRMGLGTRTKAWRFSDINKDYTFCPTYPARMVVPTKISDATLQYASKYRSKCRIPSLTYLHWANYGSITRSSQPMVGITQSRSIQDEKLIEAVFQSHYSPDSRASASPVYGATSTNLIIDARPTTNAMANTAKGAGTENMDHYKEAKKAYLGIDNIHTMRESLNKVVDALREADTLAASISNDLSTDLQGLSVLDRQTLRRSGWLRHLSAILEGTVLIVRNIHVNSSHVLIHCSDGWDRTAQLSAMSQLCLDPFYRTIRGFEILVEKDWLSFGHKFLDRCGHLSSDKFFVSPAETAAGGGSADAAQAFLASVQNRFVSQNHLKETSPVFHQFLECVRQVQRQFPERFEFNERFLQQMHYHLYSCQFGTFLFNSERERRVGEGGPPPCDRTLSVWDFFNSPAEMEKNTNPSYDPTLDDPLSRAPKADMGVLFPNPRDVRFWHELYGRTDDEMNGRIVTSQVGGVELVGPIEGADDDPIALRRSPLPSAVSLPPTPVTSPPPVSPSRMGTLSRSVSPSMAGAPLEISSSMPNVSQMVAADPPTDNSRPSFPSTSSSMSLRPTRSPSSPANPSPGLSRNTRQPDLFANTGVRSMWGKLSSNATTAFSAVQEAYGGLAKDFKGMSLAEEGSASDKTSELRSRDTLNAWGEEQSQLSTSRNPGTSYTLGASTNPWASVNKPRSPIPDISSDNPWNSVRSPPQRNSPLGDLFGSPGSLPTDPTIAHPTPRRVSSFASTPSRETPDVPLNATQSSIEQSPPLSSSNSDPLGVGLL